MKNICVNPAYPIENSMMRFQTDYEDALEDEILPLNEEMSVEDFYALFFYNETKDVISNNK